MTVGHDDFHVWFHNNFYKNTQKALSIFPRTSLNYLRVKSLSFEALILLSILTSPTRLWLKHSSNNTWIHFIKSWIFATLAIDLHDVTLHGKHETIRENAHWSHWDVWMYLTSIVSWRGLADKYLSGTTFVSSSSSPFLHNLVATGHR